jgi:hypothetical protein
MSGFNQTVHVGKTLTAHRLPGSGQVLPCSIEPLGSKSDSKGWPREAAIVRINPASDDESLFPVGPFSNLIRDGDHGDQEKATEESEGTRTDRARVSGGAGP